MKSVLCCNKVWDCCYQILQIMIQIRCKTCLGNAVAVYSIESETYQYSPGYLPCHESWCVWTTARLNSFPSNSWWHHRQMPWWQEHFCKHPFLMIIIQADSWQEKWSIPSCRALIWHSTCCLWTHALHCSLNSVAFQAESAQPGDHPLWDQNTVREGIWGARLSGLWGVIPQINMEIMCKRCVPIMLSHFFGKISWNLCGSVHNG